MTPADLNKILGNIDLFLLDQILKGTIEKDSPLLDAGCAEGRNLKYFINNGYKVFGIDPNAEAIRMAQMLYRDKAFFKVAVIAEQPFPPESFQSIICINVLHHLENEVKVSEAITSLVRMLKPGGILFIRTLLNPSAANLSENGYFLINEGTLRDLVKDNNLSWREPLKKEISEDGKVLAVIVLEKK